jgi:hypothetical protein
VIVEEKTAKGIERKLQKLVDIVALGIATTTAAIYESNGKKLPAGVEESIEKVMSDVKRRY